jgi:hypothetical protein
MDLQHLSAWLEPHRRAWYALPMFMLVFVVLAMVPVLLLIADIVVGASSVAYRLFLLGTILGRGALVIALAGFALVLNGILRRARPAA